MAHCDRRKGHFSGSAMYKHCSYVLLGLIACCPSYVMCVCVYGTADPVTNFTVVAPENYDRNYSDVTLVDRRPLGYSVGRIVYASESPELCARVCNVRSGVNIEVKTDTSVPASLCVRDSQNSNENCGVDGVITSCEAFPAAPDGCAYFQFYLNANGQANEGDVNFWYRFVVSNNTDDTWCSSRDPDDRPTSLRPYVPPAPPSTLPSASNVALVLSGVSTQTVLIGLSVVVLRNCPL